MYHIEFMLQAGDTADGTYNPTSTSYPVLALVRYCTNLQVNAYTGTPHVEESTSSSPAADVDAEFQAMFRRVQRCDSYGFRVYRGANCLQVPSSAFPVGDWKCGILVHRQGGAEGRIGQVGLAILLGKTQFRTSSKYLFRKLLPNITYRSCLFTLTRTSYQNV